MTWRPRGSCRPGSRTPCSRSRPCRRSSCRSPEHHTPSTSRPRSAQGGSRSAPGCCGGSCPRRLPLPPRGCGGGYLLERTHSRSRLDRCTHRGSPDSGERAPRRSSCEWCSCETSCWMCGEVCWVSSPFRCSIFQKSVFFWFLCLRADLLTVEADLPSGKENPEVVLPAKQHCDVCPRLLRLDYERVAVLHVGRVLQL